MSAQQKCVTFIFYEEFRVFFKSAKSGASIQIAFAVDRDWENITGKYFADCKIKKQAKVAQNYLATQS